MLLSLCSCSEQSSSSSQATTAEPTTAAASTAAKIDATGDSAGDERIYGKWSGPQVTTQGDKLADVEMEFRRNGSFDYKAKGSYEKDDVENQLRRLLRRKRHPDLRNRAVHRFRLRLYN